MMRTVNGVILSLAPASPLHAAAGQALPTRIKLLNWGTNPTSSGPVIVDDTTAKVFSVNQKAIGRERVQVDFEHNTVPGTAEFNRTNEPRPVAGHSTLVCVPGEGIYAEAVTYTADGEKSARNYEDVSLAPYLDKEGRVIAAHSWTVTHTGAAYGLDFKEAAVKTLSADLKILSTQTLNTQPSNSTMLKALVAALGLPENADEAAAVAELRKRLTPTGPTTLSADALKASIDAAIAPLIAPLTAKITSLETNLAASETARLAGRQGELVALFAAQGKVPLKKDSKAYTAEELKALSVDTLELLLANTAVTVPLSARNPAHTTETKKGYRVKVGDKEVVDLGAIFDAEAKRSGLSAVPNVNE